MEAIVLRPQLRPILVAALLAGCLAGDGPAAEADSGIRGRVMVGPTCPVERDPPDPDCEDRPLATRLAVMTPDEARRVTEFDSAENGTFRVSVPPGEYVIRSAKDSSTPPTCATGTIRVVSHNYTQVQVDCDSGIR